MSEFERITDLPLVDRLMKADSLTRELGEHLRQAYLPRLGDLRKASKHFDPKEVSDQRILDHTLKVLEAEEFTDELYGRLKICLDSIREEMETVLHGNNQTSRRRNELLDEDGLFS